MRGLGVVALLLGVLGVVVAVLLITGNPSLATPGPQVLPAALYDSWRLVLPVVLWVSAVWLALGILAVSRQPRVAWLMLLAFLPLLAVYFLGGGLLPSYITALIAIIVLGVVIPVVVGVIGVAIGSAVRRRRAALGRP
ncbi:hypothetical protein ACFJGV_12980 [Cnuibacter sp. UC19_7]|uniref:hypothetical protein n=1 Tax=Cnuibacter sp. UC19_7 TaxID=3350166 RepID=UPI00367186B6